MADDLRMNCGPKYEINERWPIKQNASKMGMRNSRRKSTPFKIPNYKQLVNPVKNAHTRTFEPICRY